jgi:N-acetylmuramoyl-L-alanine amidase/putative methionine-R-sulfoxide reductase with GAF domain
MATSPSKPEFDLPLQSVSAAAVADEPRAGVADTAAPGRDALQALLAFSSLHEQIRQRRLREARSQSTPTSEDSPDDFVLYEVLQLVAERALALTGADGVAIALLQEGEIICRAATGPIAPDVGARLDPNTGISGACLRTAKVVRCDDAERDPRVDVQISRRLNTRSMLAVPLCGRRSVVGLLEAFSTDAYGFNDTDVRSLSLLGELILGAMKPQEEERLEALSPVPLKPVGTSATQVNARPSEPSAPVKKEEPKEQIQIAVEREAVAEEVSTAQTQVAPELFQEHGTSIPSQPGLRLAILLVAAALIAGGTIWFRLHAKSTAAASVTTSSSMASELKANNGAVAEGSVVPADQVLEMSPVSTEDAQRNVLPSITGIRHWESGDSTTVAIDLQDQVQYEVHRLDSPERIYFDLHDTVLAPGLNGKTIEVGDALLLRIRVAQPMTGISRVVLETKNVSNFSVSLASNPYRLIAEIRSAAAGSQSKARLDLFRAEKPREWAKLSAAPPSVSKEDLELRARVPRMKIVVDAGHGGWDLGTVGRKGLLEKNLVLDVAQRLGDLLSSRLGSEVIYTRADDTYIPLENRAELANEAQADLFVSVHANYSDLPSARGVETYYTNFSAPANSLDIEKRENATAEDGAQAPAILAGVALKERTQESRRLAASVERALYGSLVASNPGIRDRGVKEAGFVVLTGTSMPAILAEVSFVSSPTDEQNLQSSAYRQQISEAIYHGIANYAASAASRVKMASAAGKPSGR